MTPSLPAGLSQATTCNTRASNVHRNSVSPKLHRHILGGHAFADEISIDCCNTDYARHEHLHLHNCPEQLQLQCTTRHPHSSKKGIIKKFRQTVSFNMSSRTLSMCRLVAGRDSLVSQEQWSGFPEAQARSGRPHRRGGPFGSCDPSSQSLPEMQQWQVTHEIV